jgi:hypothetical protein
MTMTNDRPDLSSEGVPVIDKTVLVNVNRNKYQVVRPSWALKPGLTDRLVVGRKVTLTLTLPSRCLSTIGEFSPSRYLATIRGFLPSRCIATIGRFLPSCCLATIKGLLPSRCLATIGGYTDTHTEQRDLISLLLFVSK